MEPYECKAAKATALNIKCESWDEDILFLKEENHLNINTVKVYTQALIHSNLFKSNVVKHGNLKVLSLAEMVTKKHKLPFVCTIIEGIY